MTTHDDTVAVDYDVAQVPDSELFGETHDMREQLELLRKRLLDLTTRNRLLNFRHMRRGSLRVVDELPDVVLSSLLEGKAFEFAAVPEPREADLANYWRARGRTFEDEEGNPLPPEKVPAQEWARHIGIHAEWEAPLPPTTGEMPRRHRDRRLQTLLYPDEMTATLRHIARQARSAREEMGVNLLHLAIGFMEWREADSSRRPLLAPLMLVPVELKRERLPGRERFSIRWSGDDLQPNLTLLYRMEQDFGLVLPRPHTEDGEWIAPEEYFRQVAEAIADFPQWQVRRYMTLSLFQFGTLLLFRDLDPDNWPQNALFRHGVLRRLLRQEAPEDPVLPLPPPETVDVELELVDLADSSQAQAINAALAGRNLVIEGPPGTGKSQTITNLIAAFLARGRKVLFVSEKMAALEVVKQRLDRLGLGTFCLDLHSHRQQKRAVLERIEERLMVRSEDAEAAARALEGTLAQLKARRAELEDYLELLRQKPGRLDRNVSDILLEAGRLRHELRKKGFDDRLMLRLLDECRPDDPFAITAEQLDQTRHQLEVFHGVLRQLLATGQPPAQHPWRGVNALSVAEYDAPVLLLRLSDAHESANALLEAWQAVMVIIGPVDAPSMDFLRALPEQARLAAQLHRLRPGLLDAWALVAELRGATGLPLPEGAAGLEAAAALLTAMEDFPVAEVSLVSPVLLDERADAALAELGRQIALLRERHEELARVFDMEKALAANPDVLEDLAAIFNEAHFLSFLNSDYRQARAQFRELARPGRDSGLDNRQRAGLLLKLSDQIRDIMTVQDGGPWREILHPVYAGVQTNVDGLQRLRTWAERHRQVLAAWPGLLEGLFAGGAPVAERLLHLLQVERRRVEALRQAVEALRRLPQPDKVQAIAASDGATFFRELALLQLAAPLAEWLAALPPDAAFPPLEEAAGEVAARLKAHEADWQKFAQLAGLREEEWLGCAFGQVTLDVQLARMKEALEAGEESVRQWLHYDRGRQDVMANPEARKLARLAERGELPAEHAGLAHAWLVMESMARTLSDEHALLRRMDARRLNDIIGQYRQLDAEAMRLRRRMIAARLAQARAPEGHEAQRKRDLTEMALIRNELKKTRRHVPIRQLMLRAGNALQTLMPCFMMSPLSVAQYLEPGGIGFDVILMDEASQLKPEHALGAIARAAQVVIVGDSRQLPPTNFFERLESEEADEDIDEAVQTSESILDLGTHALPSKMLRWHYRSRHESLIRFSNQRFYKGQLIVFPSARQDRERYGIGFHFVEDGTFANGVNLREAQRVAEAAAEHLRRGERSVGVAAMNRKQAELIAEILDGMAQDDPTLASRLNDEEGNEPFFVKNLENVQGDERDVIIISMTYGPANPGGKVPQRFGPINRDDGWRRLNVLFTRARERMEVFSSMRAHDVAPGEKSKLGVHALHEFLHYAETGNLPQLDDTPERPHEPESPFEEAVLEALRTRGYNCEPQVGVDGYYIDIGIRDPEMPERFILGVECDGARYHSLRSARDRDIIRQKHLESLGWRIHRIWSTDWFRAPERELALLEEQIRAALHNSA